MKKIRNFAAAAVASTLMAVPALAVDSPSVTFAQYVQQSSDRIVNYTNTGTGNALTITRAPVFFVVNDYGPGGVYPALLSMSASSSAFVTSAGAQFEQVGWSGTMNFTSGSTNYLTVNFTDATFSFDSAGGSASLISTDPSHPISYTSSLLTLPTFSAENFSLAFTSITPPFVVAANGYGGPFTASTAGSFAGSTVLNPGGGEVPEPASWAMMLAGFGMVGFSARRRNSRMVVAA